MHYGRSLLDPAVSERQSNGGRWLDHLRQGGPVVSAIPLWGFIRFLSSLGHTYMTYMHLSIDWGDNRTDRLRDWDSDKWVQQSQNCVDVI